MLPSFRKPLFQISVALLALFSTVQALPQETSGKRGDDDVQTFKVDVNVVNLFFNVKDKRGALVPNLTKDDFQVMEDGKPQTIKYFASESNQPLTLGLLIDSSVSQERVLPLEKEVGSAFLREVLRDKDLAFVISFDVNVDLLQDFTNDARMLRAGMNKARINSGGAGGGLPGIGGGPFPPATILAAHCSTMPSISPLTRSLPVRWDVKP